MKTVVDVLIEARGLVERGWVQGTYYKAGCYCATGAVLRATGGRQTNERVFWPDDDATALEVLEFIDGVIGRRVERFNDAPDTTQAEVLAAFDKAIEAAKREAS